MHPYATDLDKHRSVPLAIAAISVISAWILYVVLAAIPLSLPWWVDAPSVAGFYGAFYTLFDKRLWRMEPLRKALGAYDLNGKYTGQLSSSFDKHATKYSATLSVTQTWSEINIVLTTSESTSRSLTASLLTEMGWLGYEYLNEPRPGTSDTMHCHRGSARFSLEAAPDTLEGEYYSGRDRQNCGLLHFKREKTLGNTSKHS
jgi:hypothetical protein